MDIKLLELEARKKREYKIQLARISFWGFCKVMNNKFYKEDRVYLKTICTTLQNLYEDKLINPITGLPYKKLQLNCPPGFGKSYTMILFSMWVFGLDIEKKIITVSYNEKMSSKFAKAVRDGIILKKDISRLEIAFNDVFPKTKIRYGDAAKGNWALEGPGIYDSYLATSFTGTLTGMRSHIGIFDDPVRDAATAKNADELEKQYEFYTDTFLSRMYLNMRYTMN